jgi:hypothetical protein
MPTSYLAPLPRYSGSKVDRKRFRPYRDVTDRNDDAIRKIDPGFLLVLNARRPRISHRYRDVAVARWTGSGFRQMITSQNESDAAIRQIWLGFLQAVNAFRPRISHRYRDVAVARWTGSSFGHTVASQVAGNAAIRQICLGFL